MILKNVENVTYRIGCVSKEEVEAKIKATTEKERQTRSAALPPESVLGIFEAARQLESLYDLLNLSKQIGIAAPAMSPGFVITL